MEREFKCPNEDCQVYFQCTKHLVKEFRKGKLMLVCWSCDTSFSHVICTRCKATYNVKYREAHQKTRVPCLECSRKIRIKFPDPKTMYAEHRASITAANSSNNNNNNNNAIITPKESKKRKRQPEQHRPPSKFRLKPFDPMKFDELINVNGPNHMVYIPGSTSIIGVRALGPFEKWSDLRAREKRRRPSKVKFISEWGKVLMYGHKIPFARSKMVRNSVRKMLKANIDYDAGSDDDDEQEEDEAVVEKLAPTDPNVSDDEESDSNDDDDDADIPGLIDDTPLPPDTADPARTTAEESDFGNWYKTWLNTNQVLMLEGTDTTQKSRFEILSQRVENKEELSEAEWAEFYALGTAYADTKNKVRRHVLEDKLLWICKQGTSASIRKTRHIKKPRVSPFNSSSSTTTTM